MGHLILAQGVLATPSLARLLLINLVERESRSDCVQEEHFGEA